MSLRSPPTSLPWDAHGLAERAVRPILPASPVLLLSGGGLSAFQSAGVNDPRLQRDGEMRGVAVSRRAGISGMACGGGPLQRRSDSICRWEPCNGFDVGRAGTSLRTAAQGQTGNERPVFHICRSRPGLAWHFQLYLHFISPQVPPWSVCLDSYRIKCSIIK